MYPTLIRHLNRQTINKEPMNLDQFLKDIEDKVINNELKEALTLIKDFSAEHQFGTINDDAVTQLANLNNLENLNRTNQISQEDFMIQTSQISAAVLKLKKEAVLFFENPEMAKEKEAVAMTPPVETPPAPPAVQTANAVPIALETSNSNDWFKKVIIGLFVLFGGGVGHAVFMSNPINKFRIFASISLLAFVFLIKIYDDNMKFKREKLLLENQRS